MDAGYQTHLILPPTAAERGVAALSRAASSRTVEQPTGVELSHRLTVTDIAGTVTLIGVYVPSRDATGPKMDRKRRFLTQTLEVVQHAAQTGRVVLMGDLNIVSRAHRPRYRAFRSWEYDALDSIAGFGLVDAFTETHPGVQAHSWIGRTGNGYRYDYAFVSEDLVESVRGCEYLHEPREQGLSDHAALLLTLHRNVLAAGDDRSSADRPPPREPAATSEISSSPGTG